MEGRRRLRVVPAEAGSMLAERRYEQAGDVPGEPSEGCWIARARVPLHHDHGLFGLTACLDSASDDLAIVARDPRLVHFDPRRAVFLAMRHGVHPGSRLIGLIRVVGDELIAEQITCRRPDQERAALAAVARRIGLADWAVSFSRASFDRLLLQQRMAELGVPFPFPIQRHLKLVGPLKAIYGSLAGPCSMKLMESRCLGFQRPRTEDPFHENLLDLLSLAGLLGHLSRALRAPVLPEAAAAAARAAWSLGRWDDAARWGGGRSEVRCGDRPASAGEIPDAPGKDGRGRAPLGDPRPGGAQRGL